MTLRLRQLGKLLTVIYIRVACEPAHSNGPGPLTEKLGHPSPKPLPDHFNHLPTSTLYTSAV
jgi:hypothetical protein